MVTKDDLELETLKVYDDFSHLFERLKLPRLKFLAWLEGFESLTEFRACHTHVVYKILPLLKTTQYIWEKHPKNTWHSMSLMLSTHPDVLKLRNMEFLIKEQWQCRPKPRKKY